MFDYENAKNCRFYLWKVSNGQCIFVSETTLELKRQSLFILINTFLCYFELFCSGRSKNRNVNLIDFNKDLKGVFIFLQKILFF